MKIIEQLVVGKMGDPLLCEDILVVTDSFVAVADGTTDKTGWTYKGKLGGRIAAETIAETILTLPPTIDARNAINTITNKLHNIPYDGPADHPSAVLIIYSAHRKEIWQVGDAQYWFKGQPTKQEPKAVDAAAANLRAAILATYMAPYIAAGISPKPLQIFDPGRAAIIPLLERQYMLRNKETAYGYGAIDGKHVPDSYLNIIKVNPHVEEIILASDGYPNVLPTLEESETNLRKLILADPLCINELRGTKAIQTGAVSYDDRTYIRVAV